MADRVVRSLELVDDPVAFARLADPAVGTESPAVLAARIVRADPRPIVIDDARLLGGQARDLLLALAGEVPLIVGGLARDEPLLAMLEERCRPTSIDLGPLPAADAAALARRYGARGDDVVADIIALAGGYPERLAVLARNPDDVDHSAEQAIRQIRTDARLAAEAALVGLALAPLPETALSADAVEALDHSRLIVRRDGMVSAAGPVTRRVLESLATDVAANAAHRRLADAVVDDVARAEHLLLAGDRAEAHRIARSSLAGAPTPAGRARILAVAARSAEHGAEGVALVDAAARAILATESLRAARAFLAEVLEAHPELEARPAIVALDAGLRIQDGLADSARTRLDRALATRGLERAEEVRLRAIRWGLDLASGGDREVLRTDADALGPVLADEAPDLTSRMLPGISLAMQGDATWPNHLLPVLADAIARAGEEPGSSDLLLALGSEVVGFLLGAYGDLQGAVDVLARSIVALQATGSDALASDLEVMRAYTSIAVRGPDGAGLAVLRAAIPRASSVRQRCAGLAVLAQSEADRGALELAMASLERARRADDPIGSDAITQARAMVAWTGGEPARALEILGAESGGAGSFSLLPLQRWALQAWAHLDLGTTAVPEDRPVVYPAFAWVPDQVEATTALVEGDLDRAMGAARRAVARVGTPAQDHLLLRWLLGEALVRGGDLDEGLVVLDQLQADAVAQGLTPLLGRVRASLRRAGRSPAAARGPQLGGLSTREAEVLGLVGDGLTTKQIAGRLHVAPSTVDTTIKRAMAKLGARTRREAAAQIGPRPARDQAVQR
ncbi:MAG: helix-turn-helix transcriptional regulator [Acidimicrobiales bacterium]